jgi:hypothetical protein
LISSSLIFLTWPFWTIIYLSFWIHHISPKIVISNCHKVTLSNLKFFQTNYNHFIQRVIPCKIKLNISDNFWKIKKIFSKRDNRMNERFSSFLLIVLWFHIKYNSYLKSFFLFIQLESKKLIFLICDRKTN